MGGCWQDTPTISPTRPSRPRATCLHQQQRLLAHVYCTACMPAESRVHASTHLTFQMRCGTVLTTIPCSITHDAFLRLQTVGAGRRTPTQSTHTSNLGLSQSTAAAAKRVQHARSNHCPCTQTLAPKEVIVGTRSSDCTVSSETPPLPAYSDTCSPQYHTQPISWYGARCLQQDNTPPRSLCQ